MRLQESFLSLGLLAMVRKMTRSGDRWPSSYIPRRWMMEIDDGQWKQDNVRLTETVCVDQGIIKLIVKRIDEHVGLHVYLRSYLKCQIAKATSLCPSSSLGKSWSVSAFNRRRRGIFSLANSLTMLSHLDNTTGVEKVDYCCCGQLSQSLHACGRRGGFQTTNR